MLKINNMYMYCMCVCPVYMLIFDSVIMIMIIYRGHWTTAG